ncbi:acetate/propionate family kinase [Aquabacterium sp.]|uniref:acetate/propionate family kinase n=1 Tax=Aquabacterium sp. TaxID=1872578 RepID=UPI0035B4248C
MTPIEHARRPRVVLSVNCGSSTLKYAAYPIEGDDIGEAVMTQTIDGLKLDDEVEAGQPGDPFMKALHELERALHADGEVDVLAVAHRIVHGGNHFFEPVRLNGPIMTALAQLNSLAPLHQPHNLDGVRRFEAHWPGVPQIGCFDTAFHAKLPEVEQRFALPNELYEQGVRRFGFHGLSYAYVMGRLAELTPRAQGRVLAYHLGNGASACAVLNGHSVATTMGFSAVDGLVMGTRCGNLDPAVILHLLSQGWTEERIETLVYKQSGLKGLSGLSSDMRALHQSDAPSAAMAIDVFVHRAVREGGGLVACMGGVDAIAFTGGIGEHDAIVRERIVQGLAHLGVQLSSEANQQLPSKGEGPIHVADSPVDVWVVPTDEGRMAARGAARLLGLI